MLEGLADRLGDDGRPIRPLLDPKRGRCCVALASDG